MEDMLNTPPQELNTRCYVLANRETGSLTGYAFDPASRAAGRPDSLLTFATEDDARAFCPDAYEVVPVEPDRLRTLYENGLELGLANLVRCWDAGGTPVFCGARLRDLLDAIPP
jgi:hypothetical protein